jgi:hypothetical protein
LRHQYGAATVSKGTGNPNGSSKSQTQLVTRGNMRTGFITSASDDGSSIEPWPGAVGRLTYDADGHVTGLLMSGRRNEGNGSSCSPEAHSEFTAYFGTYQVDAERGLISHHVEASLSAARASGKLQRTYEIKDGLLILGFRTMRNGAAMTNRLVWKRISCEAP